MVTIDDFAKLEFKVGTVVSAEEIDGSDKLLKLKVDFGPKPESETPNVIATKEQEAPLIASEAKQSVAQENQIASSQAPRNDVKEEEPDTNSEIVHNADETIEITDAVAPVETNEIRQVLSGIKQWYKPEELVDKQFVFITNLAPRKMMGLESQGMIMAAEGEERPVPLIPSEKVPNGSKIR